MQKDEKIEKLTNEAIRVFGNEEKARIWLSSPNPAIGQSPVEVASSGETGLKAVQDLMVCIDHGIYL